MEGRQGSELAGRRALVTASTQGAGAAIARRLRDQGAEVWTCARSAPTACGRRRALRGCRPHDARGHGGRRR